jgi:hypothetical protein
MNPTEAVQLTSQVLTENPNVLLAMSDLTVVFKLPSAQKAQVFEGTGPANPDTTWSCKDLPGCSALFDFKNLGDNDDQTEQRWGVWAFVHATELGAAHPSRQKIDALAEKWVAVTAKARGFQGDLHIEPDNWDEARLRALCERHGWEFEWMAEDGERERRTNERQAFFNGAEGLTGARQVAEKAAKVQEAEEKQDVNPKVAQTAAKVQEAGEKTDGNPKVAETAAEAQEAQQDTDVSPEVAEPAANAQEADPMNNESPKSASTNTNPGL